MSTHDDNAALPGLWVCGDHRVELYAADSPSTNAQPLWSWDSQTSPSLPEPRRRWFRVMDEVKPVDLDGVSCVLVCSSGGPGGVALVRRSDGAVLMSAEALGTHSAELLPGGWIVQVIADGPDELRLHHVSDGQTNTWRSCATLGKAHGAVYDPARGLVWTCGDDRVVAWRIDAAKGTWEIVHDIALPRRWAHDLLPDPFGGGLLVTTGVGVWRLDPQSLQVTPFEPLAEMVSVKAVSVEKRSGCIAFQKGQNGTWWSDTVYLLGPGQKLRMILLPQRQLYKVRWDQPCWLME